MDFETTANELTKVSEKGLSNVSSLCKKQLQLEDRVKELKAELKETEGTPRPSSFLLINLGCRCRKYQTKGGISYKLW